jgi:carboxyvinyl-carboxyphosphonate phosphorylmutase
MKAAIAGRQDPLIAIAGRTSAIQIAGLDDAIARGKAYEQVGVDALFFVGVRTRAELDALSAATKLPIILGGGTPELSDRDYLASRRVRIALQGHQPFAAAVKAVHDTLKALREGTPPSKLLGVADAELMKRVTRDGDYSTWTKEFLGG